MADTIAKVGDLVEFDARGRKTRGTVASLRRVTKGRRAGWYEYTVAPEGEEGERNWKLQRRNPLISLGRGSAEAMVAGQELNHRRSMNISRRYNKRADVVHESRLRVGDTVWVRYRNVGPRAETVLKISANGGVGIRGNGKSGLRWVKPHQLVQNPDGSIKKG